MDSPFNEDTLTIEIELELLRYALIDTRVDYIFMLNNDILPITPFKELI